ncbi:NAD-dependent epimerase/dehydratase family protein [Limnohabitans sp. DCL3]|uniref:NAD-dependent epimerase/dehydratase family protein n=1 Tax=Limnohabitans sp. DCL3 TaxID=3374103 RepID=UPI003A837A8B
MSSSELQRVWVEDTAAVLTRELPWQKLSGLTIAVTGAGGFLGGYLVRVLLGLHGAGLVECPVRVLALVRDVERGRERLGVFADSPNLELRTWNLNDIAVPDLGNCHYVLHAASQASPRFYGTDPVGTLMPNAVGTASLLQALQRCPDPRGLLFVSSSEVYGQVGGDRTLAETDYGHIDPASVRACYAESKRLGETLCVAWYQQYGLPTYIVRPFHTYGPGLLADDGRVFADFTYNVIRGENIVMMSDGSARRAFCYASDAIAGFFTVLLSGQPATPYNVANPAGELSVMELAELLVSLYPDKGLQVERRLPPEDRNYLSSTFSRLIPDVQRLSGLGWSARVTPQQGFRRMIEAHTT